MGIVWVRGPLLGVPETPTKYTRQLRRMGSKGHTDLPKMIDGFFLVGGMSFLKFLKGYL